MEPKLSLTVYDKFLFGGINEPIGTLSWSSGELKFEGKADESARIFFDFLKPYVDSYIKSELEKKRGGA